MDMRTQTLYEHRLLIISNNVLSMTRSNGKTIMSYFDCLPKSMVRQLYFSTELPSISGYDYFQITDKDIIKGFFYSAKRGRRITEVKEDNYKLYQQTPNKIKKPIIRLMRELLWLHRWKSAHLIDWLDDYQPTDIFFVGGDSLFAFSICHFIVNKYKARLLLYLTDDYILHRQNESFVSRIRRILIKNKLNECLKETDTFFTISQPMRKKYFEIFGKDSSIVVNMSEPLKKELPRTDNAEIELIYAGSLYYGRVDVLHEIALAIQTYNSKKPQKIAKLRIYTNIAPSAEEKEKICIANASEYGGRLTREELINALNMADILVFVESFDSNQIENTRLSLSTKVSEYMSVGKPILAIGPEEIGSMMYLKDFALCINDINDLRGKLTAFLESEEERDYYGEIALRGYEKFHVKGNIQKTFIDKVFGIQVSKEV